MSGPFTPGGSGSSSPFRPQQNQGYQGPTMGAGAYNPSQPQHPGQSQFQFAGGNANQMTALQGQPQVNGMQYNPYSSGYQNMTSNQGGPTQGYNQVGLTPGTNYVNGLGQAYDPSNVAANVYGITGPSVQPSALMQAALSPQAVQANQQQLAALNFAGQQPNWQQQQQAQQQQIMQQPGRVVTNPLLYQLAHGISPQGGQAGQINAPASGAVHI